MGGLGTRTVGDPLGDGDGVLLSWSSRAQPSAVWSYTMCLGAANTRRRRAAGNPESVASAFSREPRDRIVAPVAAGLTELDGLVPGPLAAEDAKYRVKQHGQEPGRARSEDRGFGAPTFAHASRARGPEPAGLPRAGQESTRRRPRPDESKSAEPRASRRRRGRDPPADGTRSDDYDEVASAFDNAFYIGHDFGALHRIHTVAHMVSLG